MTVVPAVVAAVTVAVTTATDVVAGEEVVAREEVAGDAGWADAASLPGRDPAEPDGPAGTAAVCGAVASDAPSRDSHHRAPMKLPAPSARMATTTRTAGSVRDLDGEAGA